MTYLIPTGSDVTTLALIRLRLRNESRPAFQPVPKKPGDLMLVGGEMVEVR